MVIDWLRFMGAIVGPIGQQGVTLLLLIILKRILTFLSGHKE